MAASRIPRSGGLGLLVYGVGTAAAFMASGAPGGEYTSSMVRDYLARGHWTVAFVLWYVGALSALGLLLVGAALRRTQRDGDVLWGLSVAGCALSVAGAFVAGGVDVAMAEGGDAVRSGVSLPMVYTLTEIGNLLAVCAPALVIGVVALVLAARSTLPGWLRVFSAVAGVCGILAPFFFTYFVFTLWTVAAGITIAVSGRDVSRSEEREMVLA
jgi:hypothetical protein